MTIHSLAHQHDFTNARRSVPLDGLPALSAPARPPDGGGLRVGILGGSFSPPHAGHVLLAHAALLLEGLDAVVVVPAFSHAFGKGLCPFPHRLALCRIAFATLGPRVIVSDLERLLPRPSYTVNTLRALHEAWPAPHVAQWRLLQGSDVAGELALWREPEAVMWLAPPLVAQRIGCSPPDSIHGDNLLAGGHPLLPDISSTAIRAAISGHGDPRDLELVPDGVLAYIRRHRLERHFGDRNGR